MILVRCDVSEIIGWGHFKRCLTLCESLKNYSPVTFLMSCRDERVNKMVIEKGCSVFNLPSNLSYQDEVKHYPNICKNVIIDLGYRNNLANIQNFTNYLIKLKSLDYKIILIDGLGDESYRAENAPHIEGYIQPYWGVPLHPEPKTDNWLHGKKSVLVESVYFDSYTKRNPQKIKNLLITFGGSDPQGITLTVLGALNKLAEEVNIRCIIGPSFSTELTEAVKNIQTNQYLDILYSPENLLQHYKWADLCICGSGSTRYEAAAVGLPVLFTAIYEEHANFSSIFATFETSRYVGVYSNLSMLDWATEIENLIKSSSCYKKMVKSITKMRTNERGSKWLSKKIQGIFNNAD